MRFVKGKKMEESDLCMFLENMGVVLDRATWMHFKEVYARSHVNKENGKIEKFILMQLFYKNGNVIFARSARVFWT